MPADPVLDEGPAPGTLVADKYRVLSPVGSGGMGCLVKAEHLLLKKPVAIKFLRAQAARSVRGRFFREARTAQALSSENVVRVFDAGVHDESPYIVMELLEGTDLAARVDHVGPLDVGEAVDCVIEACVAVAEAHALGIIHRDIKPSNLFLTDTPTKRLVKVLDFGISKVPEGEAEEDCEQTGENTVLGTPHYMSPEQLRNPANIDARADIWGLGVTLQYLLCGEHPFIGRTAREVTAAIFTDAPRDPRALRPDLPAELCTVVARALAKRPEERTATVVELVQELLPFATKRGLLAAERIAAMREPPPARAARPAARSDGRSRETTTDAGLSSTLPTTEDASRVQSAPIEDVQVPRQGARWTLRAGLLIAAAAAAAASILVWPKSTEDSATGARPSAAPHRVDESRAPRTSALPVEASSAAARSSVAPEASTLTNAVQRTPAERNVKRDRRHPPAGPASSTAAPPPPPVDIDGVPIVE